MRSDDSNHRGPSDIYDTVELRMMVGMPEAIDRAKAKELYDRWLSTYGLEWVHDER